MIKAYKRIIRWVECLIVKFNKYKKEGDILSP